MARWEDPAKQEHFTDWTDDSDDSDSGSSSGSSGSDYDVPDYGSVTRDRGDPTGGGDSGSDISDAAGPTQEEMRESESSRSSGGSGSSGGSSGSDYDAPDYGSVTRNRPDPTGDDDSGSDLSDAAGPTQEEMRESAASRSSGGSSGSDYDAPDYGSVTRTRADPTSNTNTGIRDAAGPTQAEMVASESSRTSNRRGGGRTTTGRDEQYGDFDWSAGFGGPEDEVEQFFSREARKGRQGAEELADTIFGSRPSGLRQTGATATEEIVGGTLNPAEWGRGIQESAEAAVWGIGALPGGNPRATEEDFRRGRRRRQQASEDIQALADDAVTGARENPYEAAGVGVGVLADVALTGGISRAARGGSTARSIRGLADDASGRARRGASEFASDTRGQADLTGAFDDAAREADDTVTLGAEDLDVDRTGPSARPAREDVGDIDPGSRVSQQRDRVSRMEDDRGGAMPDDYDPGASMVERVNRQRELGRQVPDDDLREVGNVENRLREQAQAADDELARQARRQDTAVGAVGGGAGSSPPTSGRSQTRSRGADFDVVQNPGGDLLDERGNVRVTDGPSGSGRVGDAFQVGRSIEQSVGQLDRLDQEIDQRARAAAEPSVDVDTGFGSDSRSRADTDIGQDLFDDTDTGTRQGGRTTPVPDTDFGQPSTPTTRTPPGITRSPGSPDFTGDPARPGDSWRPRMPDFDFDSSDGALWREPSRTTSKTFSTGFESPETAISRFTQGFDRALGGGKGSSKKKKKKKDGQLSGMFDDMDRDADGILDKFDKSIDTF